MFTAGETKPKNCLKAANAPPSVEEAHTKRSHSAKTCYKKHKKQQQKRKKKENKKANYFQTLIQLGQPTITGQLGVDGNEAAKKCSQSASQAKVKGSQGNRVEIKANPTEPNPKQKPNQTK